MIIKMIVNCYKLFTRKLFLIIMNKKVVIELIKANYDPIFKQYALKRLLDKYKEAYRQLHIGKEPSNELINQFTLVMFTTNHLEEETNHIIERPFGKTNKILHKSSIKIKSMDDLKSQFRDIY